MALREGDKKDRRKGPTGTETVGQNSGIRRGLRDDEIPKDMCIASVSG